MLVRYAASVTAECAGQQPAEVVVTLARNLHKAL